MSTELACIHIQQKPQNSKTNHAVVASSEQRRIEITLALRAWRKAFEPTPAHSVSDTKRRRVVLCCWLTL
jgi:hypothetical protein